MRAARNRRRITEETIDLGFALMPDARHTNREVCPYSGNSAEVRAAYEHQRFEGVLLGIEGAGTLG